MTYLKSDAAIVVANLYDYKCQMTLPNNIKPRFHTATPLTCSCCGMHLRVAPGWERIDGARRCATRDTCRNEARVLLWDCSTVAGRWHNMPRFALGISIDSECQIRSMIDDRGCSANAQLARMQATSWGATTTTGARGNSRCLHQTSARPRRCRTGTVSKFAWSLRYLGTLFK